MSCSRFCCCRRKQPVTVVAFGFFLAGLFLPLASFAQGSRTPVDVFSQTGFGRRTEMFYFQETPPSINNDGKPMSTFDLIFDYLGSNLPKGDSSTGSLSVVVDYVPLSAIDGLQKKTYDYFCVGADISVNVPTSFAYKDMNVRFWTDYDVSVLKALNVVPTSTTGSWSTSETSSWSVDGSVGMFGWTPTSMSAVASRFRARSR